MEVIDFIYNWNNKLDCNSFTTFRINNPNKYITGNTYEITVKGKKKKEVVLIAQKAMKLNDVNEWVAQIDTGYTKQKYIEMVMKMYKNKGLDFEKQLFVLLLLETDKGSVAEPSAVNQKIAMFCRKYEQYTKVKYKPSAADSGKIKLFSVTEDILDHYFTSDNFLFKHKYSIANLAKYYNELILDMQVVKIGAHMKLHPNSWNAQYAKNLSGAELSSYYQHLLSLGLESKKDRFGNVIDFVPAQPKQ